MLAAFVTGDQPTISGRAIFGRMTPEEKVPPFSRGFELYFILPIFYVSNIILGLRFSVVTLTLNISICIYHRDSTSSDMHQ